MRVVGIGTYIRGGKRCSLPHSTDWVTSYSYTTTTCIDSAVVCEAFASLCCSYLAILAL